MLVQQVHHSGKWSAAPDDLMAALAFYADELSADVIALTEVSPQGFRKPLVAWAQDNGYYLWHPAGAGHNECAVLSRYAYAKRTSRQLSSLKLKYGRTAPTFLTTVKITEGVGWLGVLHTPAHTNGLHDYGKAAWPTRVYRSVQDGLHVYRRMVGGKFTISADWNLDLNLAKNRRYLARPYPRMYWGWRRGQDNTEGNRVIDGVLTGLRIKNHSVTQPLQHGFDHHGVLTVFSV